MAGEMKMCGEDAHTKAGLEIGATFLTQEGRAFWPQSLGGGQNLVQRQVSGVQPELRQKPA